MKRFLILALFTAATAHAQLRVDFTIDVERDTARISPFIYGINWVHGGEPLHADWNLGSRRLGGNRLSSYNWEVNASNSGNDCDDFCRNQNDNWLTHLLVDGESPIPALLPKTFHDDSRTLGAYSLVQLQAAGYVAADQNSNIRPVPPAPSARWKEVRFAKGAPFAVEPDPTDAYVYMDEQVNALVQSFGTAANGGVQGYGIDNEPGLWYTSHPRLRGLPYNSADEVLQAERNGVQAVRDAKAKTGEVIRKSIDLATAVKVVDPAAEIFGPSFWGFLDYWSLQEAPDWPEHRDAWGMYVNMYLGRMREASQAAGMRLLDVLDLHWYPQMEETPEKIVQAPRSLWDPAYLEDSWITRDVLKAPIALLPTLKASIGQHYPGTRIAVTEFRFGDADNGNTWYSGVAVADALGIFGREGVYAVHYHPTNLEAPIEGYVAAAYKIYRSYDGAKSTFGSTSVYAATSDVEASSIHAALDDATPRRLHLIVINKSMDRTLDGRFMIASPAAWASGRAWAFDNTSSTITERDRIASIDGNVFTYVIAPMTVAHIVLVPRAADVADDSDSHETTMAVSDGGIRLTLPRSMRVRIELADPLGRIVAVPCDERLDVGMHTIAIDREGLPGGLYFCRMVADEFVRTVPVVLLR